MGLFLGKQGANMSALEHLDSSIEELTGTLNRVRAQSSVFYGGVKSAFESVAFDLEVVISHLQLASQKARGTFDYNNYMRIVNESQTS